MINYPYLPEGKTFKYVPITDRFMAECKRVTFEQSTERNHPTGAVVVKDKERRVLLLEIEPQPFDWIEFGRAGRQSDQRQARGDYRRMCAVPAGLIEHPHDVFVRLD